MSSALTPTPSQPLIPPRGPTLEEWAALSPARQAALEDELYAQAREYEAAYRLTLSEAEQQAMAESDSHHDASHDTKQSLRAFFRRSGGSLYIASNMAVYYPGENHFAPDLMAVRDVPLRKRSSYVVAREGKGLDLAVEIIYRGKRQKDLQDNLSRYARLGIPEYFVVDLPLRRVHGYQLSNPAARRYAPLLGNHGRYRSAVLGLDLAIDGDELRFYSGTATVPLLSEEVDRLTAQLQREQEQSTAAAEAVTAAQEQALAAQEQAAVAREEARQLRAQLGEAILSILRLRGLSPSPEQVAQLRACTDAELLQRWLTRAPTAKLDQIFAP